MATLYQWAVGLFDDAIDDICVLFEKVIGALTAMTGVLFALLTLASLFG